MITLQLEKLFELGNDTQDKSFGNFRAEFLGSF